PRARSCSKIWSIEGMCLSRIRVYLELRLAPNESRLRRTPDGKGRVENAQTGEPHDFAARSWSRNDSTPHVIAERWGERRLWGLVPHLKIATDAESGRPPRSILDDRSPSSER